MKQRRVLVGVVVVSLFSLAGCSKMPTNRVVGGSAANAFSQTATNPVGSVSEPGETYVETLTLPDAFTATQDGYPVGLYWALQNVISKHNGYDLSKELGKTIRVYLTHGHFIFRDASGKLVGDEAPTATLEQITHETFDRWIESQHPPYSAARLKMSPEDTIKAFYQAIDQHNDSLAWSYADPEYSHNLMGSALPHGLPDPRGWGTNNFSHVIEQIEVLFMKQIPSENTHIHYTVPTKFFEVRTNGQYQGFVYPSGINTWVVEMVKPTANSPWMYSGTPTGGY